MDALICDLDNTLFSPRTIPREVLQPVFDAVLAANAGASRADPELLTRALEEGWKRPFDVVAEQYALPAWVLGVWSRANGSLEVQGPLPLFDDVGWLWSLPLRRFLVTTGFRSFQESKVRALGIAGRFEAVLVDAIDDGAPEGKQALFARIVERHGIEPSRVVVLGDSAESEIAAGNRLGMITVQVVREGIAPAQAADFRISSCVELPGILRALDSTATS